METPLPRRQGIVRLLSPTVIVNALKHIAHRFTLTFVFVCLDTLYALFFILFPNALPDHIETGLTEGLVLGTMLTLASYLWGEYFGKKRYTAIALAVSVAAAIANFASIALHLQALNQAHYVAYASVIVACCVAIAFTPPLGHSDTRRRWLYTMHVVKAALYTWCIQIVLLAAVLIINGTLSILFGINNVKLWECLMLVAGGTIPAFALLYMLPGADAEVNPDSLCRTLAAFCKNILLPLVLVYMLILYAYTLRIIASWTLPNGQITWMVTGLVSAIMVTVYGLQGYLCDLSSKPSAKRIAALAHRWLPLLTLPLLALMSVAIFYRIGQYGITTSRLYVATFNIWAYAAIIYIMVARQPRLNNVAASFALIFIATSIVPGLNYSSIGTQAIQHRIFTSLREAGVEKFPISYNELKRTLDTMPHERAATVAGDLSYLDSWDDHSAVAPIVTHDGTIWKWELVSDTDDDIVEIEAVITDRGLSPVPEGLRSIRYLERTSWSRFQSDNGTYAFEIDSIAVLIPVDSLIKTRDYDFEPINVPVEGSENTFRVTGITLRSDTSDNTYRHISVKGYLLEK